MALKYVYSGAAGAGTGADWANAYTTLAAASAAIAAGDTIYVADDHNATQASAKTITFPNSNTAVTTVTCARRVGGSVPPVSADIRNTAQESTTGNNNLRLDAASGAAARVIIEGIIFNCGSGAVSPTFLTNFTSGGDFIFKNCQLNILATGASSYFHIGLSGSSGKMMAINSPFSFGATGQSIQLQGGTFTWKNTASGIGGTVPSSLITGTVGNGDTMVEGVDLSAAGSGKTLVGGSFVAGDRVVRLKNCRLGASVTVASTPTNTTNATTELINCDSGNTSYRNERYTPSGNLTTETTIVRTGGASENGQAVSWKLVSNANAAQLRPMETFPFAVRNAVVGSSVSLRFEVVNDGTTLTNAELFVEVEYPDSASYPTVALASSGPADVLAAASNLSTSSETWTTTGLSSPTKQYVSVTFTPQRAGYITGVLKFGRASKTIYVCPKLVKS